VALQQSPLKNSIHPIVVGFYTICSGQPCSLFTRIGSGLVELSSWAKPANRLRKPAIIIINI